MWNKWKKVKRETKNEVEKYEYFKEKNINDILKTIA